MCEDEIQPINGFSLKSVLYKPLLYTESDFSPFSQMVVNKTFLLQRQSHLKGWREFSELSAMGKKPKHDEAISVIFFSAQCSLISRHLGGSGARRRQHMSEQETGGKVKLSQ